MKNMLSAHKDTISILSKQKEAQIKLYKTHEDKKLEKVIELEHKVKVLDNIIYKTGQTVQTMNMLNNKCRTSFAKPKFLKKAKRANPRLYDIGCYNDNLAVMLAPESDEVIHLEKEIRSKLNDLIKPFDYTKLNNLYDLFVPQREKSSEQQREYYYADHMNAILSVYTELDEVTNLQCNYMELLQKCECLETELSKSKMMSKSFESVQKHAINLELELQQCKEKIQNDMCADNRPPMLEKDMYDSWKSRMELYMLNRPHGRMILESVEQGPLIWPSVEVEEVTRLKKYSELSAAEAIQADCDVKATNI
nr:hypothetical protein [Tanacetum cinerariifolium]